MSQTSFYWMFYVWCWIYYLSYPGDTYCLSICLSVLVMIWIPEGLWLLLFSLFVSFFSFFLNLIVLLWLLVTLRTKCCSSPSPFREEWEENWQNSSLAALFCFSALSIVNSPHRLLLEPVWLSRPRLQHGKHAGHPAEGGVRGLSAGSGLGIRGADGGRIYPQQPRWPPLQWHPEETGLPEGSHPGASLGADDGPRWSSVFIRKNAPHGGITISPLSVWKSDKYHNTVSEMKPSHSLTMMNGFFFPQRRWRS